MNYLYRAIKLTSLLALVALLSALNLGSVSAQDEGFRDDFDGGTLHPRWTWERNGTTGSYALSGGFLTLTSGDPGGSWITTEGQLFYAPDNDMLVFETRLRFDDNAILHAGSAGLYSYNTGGIVVIGQKSAGPCHFQTSTGEGPDRTNIPDCNVDLLDTSVFHTYRFEYTASAVQFFDCVRFNAYRQLGELLIIGML